MRIAQVSPLHESTPPKLYGGTERVVSYLTEELVRQGHDVTLFASGDSVTSAELIAPCGRALRLDPDCRDPLAYHIIMLDQVYSCAKKFDVIHFHIDYLHFPVSRRQRVPQLTTLHGRLDLPELRRVYRQFREMPLVSISDAQRRPLAWANWRATVFHGLPENLYSLESRPGELHASVAMAGGGGISKDSDTTCVNAMDRMGNAFTATPSGAWIPSVIAGDTGIPFSVRLESFVLTPGHANQLAPGKRPRVTLSPTLVMRGSDLAFTLSTPGGDNQDQALIQVLLNIIDFGMQPQQAVEEARFQSKAYYNSFGYHEFNPGQVSLENRLQHSVGDRLAQMGHKVQWEEAWSNTSAPTVILKAKDGVLMGGADPRRARFVFGR